MATRKVNVEKGKQGFQPTTPGQVPPSAVTQPPVPSPSLPKDPGGSADLAAMHARLETMRGKPMTADDLDVLQYQEDYLFAIDDCTTPEFGGANAENLERLRERASLYAQSPMGRVSIKDDVAMFAARPDGAQAAAVLGEILDQYR